MAAARRTVTLCLSMVLAAVVGLGTNSQAGAAEEYNFAGSVQLDYSWVPHGPRSDLPPGPGTTFEGFTMEAALKVAVDISDHLSANVKACYGCHGVELDMAYFDYRVVDEFNLRAGRFSPSFGSFNLRHDPANHMLSDKPLPYDMGRMLRKEDWNEGILPAPFPSNGVQLDGTHWAGDSVQFDYALYAVTGFKNDDNPHPTDLNWQASHLLYYVDKSLRPATGTRMALTIKASTAVDSTLGASAMLGSYGPKHDLIYLIAGADLSVRVQRTALRAEYLVRRQQIDRSKPEVLKYPLAEADFVLKQGAYVELEQPLSGSLDFTGRVDGLWRIGNLNAAPISADGMPTTLVNPLEYRSHVLRETLGLELAFERNFRLKGSIEWWQFSYPDSLGDKNALGFHLGAVGSF